jgi:hypothetical protein
MAFGDFQFLGQARVNVRDDFHAQDGCLERIADHIFDILLIVLVLSGCDAATGACSVSTCY